MTQMAAQVPLRDSYIHDLELKLGGLTTTSNYWVTTTCPLDILLGRPWQCQNLVSIDKRLNGTYIPMLQQSKQRLHARNVSNATYG